MTINEQHATRIPVVCADPSFIAGAEMFDPNSWTGGSKGIIQSCWTTYSVLHHCVGEIAVMCEDADRLCATNIATIQDQWRLAEFDLDKVTFFGQQPNLHIRIQAFFSGVKSVLDLIAQLLTTEGIVDASIDGFHRDKNVCGGKVLNALRRNAVKDKKDEAARLDALIIEHKNLWIDQLVGARDLLVHPARGMHQLMFGLEFAKRNGGLVFVKAHSPHIESAPINFYALGTIKQLTMFSEAFLALARGATRV